jgi:Sap-like sulfolipid-1-addressing protein
VLHAALQLLLYAFLAGLSPVAFAATIAVMPAGRVNVLGFGSAFVVAQLLTCVIFVVIGVAAATRKSQPGLHASLEIAVAVGLVVLALELRRRHWVPKEGSSPRTQAVIERLGRLRFLTTLVAGVLLGIGGPKRLVLTALAAGTITTSGLSDSGEGVLVVLFVVLATVLVWAPAVLFALLGERCIALMKRAQEEVAAHQPHVTFYSLLILAGLFAADAAGTLLL